jgi:hypothetical protein
MQLVVETWHPPIDVWCQSRLMLMENSFAENGRILPSNDKVDSTILYSE